MPNTEQVIVACASCGTQYNVSTMAPGAKFRCQKCSTINIVPAAEELPLEQAPPPPPSRPQTRPLVKTPLKPVTPPPRQPTSRVPTSRVAPALKKRLAPKRKLSARTSAEGDDGNVEMDTKKAGALGGLLDPKNRKYLLISGAVLLVLMSVFYVTHSNNVYEKNKRIGEQATEAINEINGFNATKDYTKALEKSEAFIKEFKDCDIPMIIKNVEDTKKSIRGIEQTIERETEGKAKLAGLIDRKNNATADQYEDLMKEFSKFITKYGEFSRLLEKAQSELKDINAKSAARQEEEDTKAYSDLMAEIKPMVDDGQIDAAIARLKKYWADTPKISKRLQGAIKKKQSELKAMK